MYAAAVMSPWKVYCKVGVCNANTGGSGHLERLMKTRGAGQCLVLQISARKERGLCYFGKR